MFQVHHIQLCIILDGDHRIFINQDQYHRSAHGPNIAVQIIGYGMHVRLLLILEDPLGCHLFAAIDEVQCYCVFLSMNRCTMISVFQHRHEPNTGTTVRVNCSFVAS